MNETEQGVLKPGKLIRLLVHILWLSTFCLTHNVSAQTATENTSADIPATQKHHAYIIYSPDNTLHSSIVKQLSRKLHLSQPGIIISEITPQQKAARVNPATDLIISIGRAGMQSASEHYPKTKKLFIATDPNRYQLKTNEGDAALYMTQSYCRQMKLIRLLNAHWKTISILSSEKKPIDSKPIQQCAGKYNFEIYKIKTTAEENQTNKIRQALRNSDVLLALPDHNIYNSRSVKNILLTSYRYRRPVIAFSKNFVNAGALASIHSNTEQIAQSASNIINQYFEAGAHFKKPVNYPDDFNININKQVFRALDIPLPEIETLTKSLQSAEKNNAGDAP